MELSLPEVEKISGLPKELQEQITQNAQKMLNHAFATNDIEEAIQAVTVLSASRGIRYDNLEKFTRLVHILANKLNVSTMAVASEFNALKFKNGLKTPSFSTPTSAQYGRLITSASELMNNWNAPWRKGSIEEKKENLYNSLNNLIKQGLDVNMTYSYEPKSKTPDESLLIDIINMSPTSSAKLVELLLNAGANPHYKNKMGNTALDVARKRSLNPWDSIEVREEYKKIIQLLGEAMAKHPPSH